MPQFLLLADDFTDDEALNRRLAVRETHLAHLREVKANGVLEFAGARLSAEDKMIGSVVVVNAADENEALEILKKDPYYAGKVWDKMQVTPIRVAKL